MLCLRLRHITQRGSPGFIDTGEPRLMSNLGEAGPRPQLSEHEPDLDRSIEVARRRPHRTIWNSG